MSAKFSGTIENKSDDDKKAKKKKIPREKPKKYQQCKHSMRCLVFSSTYNKLQSCPLVLTSKKLKRLKN